MHTSRQHRRGAALVYITICLPFLIAIFALCVDGSRARTAKAELQTVTDAAVRYAAFGMRSSSAGASAASANAAAVFAQNNVDGAVAPFNSGTDLTIGIWIPATRTFTPATLATGANAVRIQSRLALGTNGRPYTLLSALGKAVEINAEAIAMMNGTTGSTWVSAKSNPWLAGMPSGSKTENLRPDNPTVHDYAGSGPNVLSSPGMINLPAAGVNAQGTIMFDAVTGTAANDGSSGNFTADGNTGWIVNLGTANGIGASNWPLSVNGIANVRSPINGMIAVFLSDALPTATSAPAALDFTSAASRDYQTISPLLKQPFFVGDGRRANGEAQQIVVPPGATRLYIGNMDAWQWNDNTGGYNATINSTTSVSTVR